MTAPLPATRLDYRVAEDGTPLLLPGGSSGLHEALLLKRAAFVPEWRGEDDSDAGIALARIWANQAQAVVDRLQQLPTKLERECLAAGGLSPRPQRPASALLAFEPDMDNLAQPLAIPVGYQISSPRADGGKGAVIWETASELVLPALKLEEAFVAEAEGIREVDPTKPFLPFGDRPGVGTALYFGFSAGGDPGQWLALGLVKPPNGEPAARGGRPSASAIVPVLRWETLSRESGFARADLIGDGSVQFSATGIVTLALRPGWNAAVPGIAPDRTERLWLRVRLVSGGFAKVPELDRIVPHAANAVARQTFRDFPIAVEGGSGAAIARLGKINVEPGSVVLESRDPLVSSPVVWEEVAALAGQPASASVFTLDAASGTVSFGDGREGAALPEGLRYLQVRALATVAGAESRVAAEAIAKPLRRLPGLAKVSNPLPANGGSDLESDDLAVREGPARIKARGRAVTAADVAILAAEANGANIARAWVVAGVDATLGGAIRPGAIGVFVIPTRSVADPAGEPLIAGNEALSAVAAHLAERVGPALARVTVGNPAFHRVRAELELACRAGADLGQAASTAEAAINAYLNPEPGAGDQNWQLGGTIRHVEVVRRALSASIEIVSVVQLTLVVDGLRRPSCSDIALSQFGLPMPDRHDIRASYAEAAA